MILCYTQPNPIFLRYVTLLRQYLLENIWDFSEAQAKCQVLAGNRGR